MGLKLQYEFAVEGPARSVEELTESGTVEIVLNVAVVVAIEDVVDTQSDPRVALLDGDADAAPDL
jgi:hypothetical protein